MYQELQVERYLVDYERVPLTDEKAPEEQDVDDLVSEGVLNFVCFIGWTPYCLMSASGYYIIPGGFMEVFLYFLFQVMGREDIFQNVTE